MGRPSKNLTGLWQVRVQPEQDQRVKELAEAEGLSVSEFIRRRALGGAGLGHQSAESGSSVGAAGPVTPPRELPAPTEGSTAGVGVLEPTEPPRASAGTPLALRGIGRDRLVLTERDRESS